MRRALSRLPPNFRAQEAAATPSGVVSDPNGAVVSGALVTLTQQSTGVRRETTTNGEGLYTLTSLAAGDYQLGVMATGFQAAPLNVTLQVGRSTTQSVPLEVAAARVEPVVVTGAG